MKPTNPPPPRKVRKVLGGSGPPPSKVRKVLGGSDPPPSKVGKVLGGSLAPMCSKVPVRGAVRGRMYASQLGGGREIVIFTEKSDFL